MVPSKLLFAVTVFATLLCAQDPGSLAGVITNSNSGAAVAGVKVFVSCFTAGSTRCREGSAVTDASGAFRLPGLVEGRYQMSVEKDGFSQALGRILLATVVASKETRFDVQLTPLSSLEGRVIDPQGKPVAGIMVQSGLGPKATTNEQGVFVLKKLTPSLVRLSAKVEPQLPGKDGERLVNTYYPSEISAEQAIPIKVDGVDLSGYEIRLRTAQARSIRGVLLDADGNPMPHSPVRLTTAALTGLVPVMRGSIPQLLLSSLLTQSDQSETGADGVFEFPAVLEGDWILRGFTLGGGDRQGGATDVHVGRSDIDNTTVRLSKLFPIEVTPEWNDARSTETAVARVSIVPLDGQNTAGGGVDADPPFTQHSQGLPGRYLIAPEFATPGFYVSAVMLNGRNVLGQAVELSGPSSVKLVLKKDGGTLRGSVEKGGGSTVVLMAEPMAYVRFGLSAQCDADGNFSIRDVPPGNYTAVAFQDKGILGQRDLLSRFDSTNSKRVKLESGATETVALRVN